MMQYLRGSTIYSSRTFYFSPLFPSRTFSSRPCDVAQSPAATNYRSLLQENFDVDIRGATPSDEVELPQSKVGIFWDLENKPPISVSPYDAAIKLRKTFSSFGIVKHMVTYASPRAVSDVSLEVKQLRNERNVLNHLENKGIIKPVDPYVCKVCGRKFYTNVKLMNHFEIHERQHKKRAAQIRSQKGKWKDGLIRKYAIKLEKFKNASIGVATPEVKYSLAAQLKRAGFQVKTSSDRPQSADIALRNHMIDLMNFTQVQCLVLVSDDSDFLDVLKEARERCVKTVVVSDRNNGVLMRYSDVSFSWRDILVGKAKKEAVSVMREWSDRDVSERVELNDPVEVEMDTDELNDSSDFEDELDKDGECGDSSVDDDKPWWELD